MKIRHITLVDGINFLTVMAGVPHYLATVGTKLLEDLSMKVMKDHSWCCALVLVIALWCAAPISVNASPITPAVEYDSTSTLTDSRPFTLGYQFTTSVLFDVNALAYWIDGRGNNHQVGLWNSTGTLLASTTVLNTDPIQGHFQYHSIPTITLVPGTYTIGGEFLGRGDPFPYQATGVVTASGFIWVTDEQLFGSGLNYPTLSTGGGYGQNGILAANFSIASTDPVPEPSTILLLTTGLLGLLGYGRRWKKLAA